MAGHVVGCIVDDVEEVLTLPAEAIQPPPATAVSVDSEYLLGVARHDGRLLILLDLDRVLSEHQQQALSSVAEPMEELQAAAT
jgi:purine-binding chemotaxis protein CheW